MQPKTSAVSFPTLMRPHIALAVADIERAVAFYRRLFGQEPTKLRADYAKFEVFEPPLNLSLNLSSDVQPQRSPAHFGIQVKSTADVLAQRERMTAAGFGARDEEAVTCCYAVQDKVWFDDPDGHHWEVFVVTQPDTAVHSAPAQGVSEVGPSAASACCAPSCCR